MTIPKVKMEGFFSLFSPFAFTWSLLSYNERSKEPSGSMVDQVKKMTLLVAIAVVILRMNYTSM